MNIEKLETYAKQCLEKNQPIHLLIEMPGFEEPELISNPPENIEKKLEYYRATYDENCEHKHAKGIRIVDVVYDEEPFTFGWAIERLKEGYKVARSGWNGKGMFIYLVGGSLVNYEDLRNEAAKHITPEVTAPNEIVAINSHIDMKAADGSIVVGWLASQTDMLAEDWEIVE